jgi:predicted nucleic acid-binding protein
MKDKDVDIHLKQHLSGNQPREAFRQQMLHDSTAEFVRVYRRRSALRRAELAAAAVLIAGIAFLGGRLSVPPALPRNVDITPQATAKSEGVTVSSDLVAWLDAARLFNQLGMQDRMARAVERASRLLPADTFIAKDQASQVFADEPIDNQTEYIDPTDVSGPQTSAESINQILAQVFGD